MVNQEVEGTLMMGNPRETQDLEAPGTMDIDDSWT